MLCYFSDGSARSGLFAASCYMIDLMKSDQEVDVFFACRNIISQRPSAIESFVSRSSIQSRSTVDFIKRRQTLSYLALSIFK